MVDFETFKKMALSFPDTEEQPHFHLTSFRFKNKIFATYHSKEQRAMIRLTLISQSVFCAYNSSIFYPVPGGWGKKGATYVDLKKVRKDIFKDALSISYKELTQKKPAK